MRRAHDTFWVYVIAIWIVGSIVLIVGLETVGVDVSSKCIGVECSQAGYRFGVENAWRIVIASFMLPVSHIATHLIARRRD